MRSNQRRDKRIGVCITSAPLAQTMEHVKSQGVEIVEGPVERTGAVGKILSFYFRDPDGNLVEVVKKDRPGIR